MKNFARPKSEVVDVECEIRSEREKAIAVSIGEIETVDGRDREKWVWLPRSQIEVEIGEGKKVIVTLPEWLAREKELI